MSGGETLPNGNSLGSGQSIISYELGFKKKLMIDFHSRSNMREKIIQIHI